MLPLCTASRPQGAAVVVVRRESNTRVAVGVVARLGSCGGPYSPAPFFVRFHSWLCFSSPGPLLSPRVSRFGGPGTAGAPVVHDKSRTPPQTPQQTPLPPALLPPPSSSPRMMRIDRRRTMMRASYDGRLLSSPVRQSPLPFRISSQERRRPTLLTPPQRRRRFLIYLSRKAPFLNLRRAKPHPPPHLPLIPLRGHPSTRSASGTPGAPASSRVVTPGGTQSARKGAASAHRGPARGLRDSARREARRRTRLFPTR